MNLFRNQFNIVNGFEIGLINEAGIAKGAQFGLIKLSKYLYSIQIGTIKAIHLEKLYGYGPYHISTFNF